MVAHRSFVSTNGLENAEMVIGTSSCGFLPWLRVDDREVNLGYLVLYSFFINEAGHRPEKVP